MESLSKINLIHKVNEELCKSLGVEDDNLAEYLIYLCKKAKSLEAFCKDVFENGGEIEQSVLKYLYDIIKPSGGESGEKASGGKEAKRDGAEEEEEDGVDKEHRMEIKMIEKKNEKMKRFQCLSIKNDEQLTRLSEGSAAEGGSDTATGGGRHRERGRPRDRSRHRDRSHHRDRSRSRDRSHSRERGRHRDRSRQRDRSHSRDGSRRNRDGKHHREESRQLEGERKRRRREGAEARELRVNNIFSGTVSKVMDFGIFVSFRSEPGGYKEGLVHCTDILPNRKRVANMREQFQRGMKVKVKVKALFGEKISLNMAEVDQKTGKNLVSDDEGSGDGESGNGESRHGVKPRDKNIASIFDDLHEDYKELKRHNSDVFKEDPKDTIKYESVIKMQSDYSKWEIQQLIKSGLVYDEQLKREYLNLRNDEKIEDEEEIIEIEVNEREPAFLKGQTTKAGAKLSPIQVIVNAEGSLARAITTTSALAKERKEQKQNEQNAIYDSIPKDISRPWEDPKPELGERTIAEALKNIGKNFDLPEWRKNYLHNNISIGVKNPMPVNEQRAKLPIYNLKKDLMKAIAKNNVLIVIGETGSGKTTQIPQYLHEANYTDKGIVGCTQPRRVAAMSIAKRVSEEFGCILGQEVGYSIRFDDCTSNDTIIKYLTDGMLLRETLSDTMLSKYSFIILDEAHERTISTDILFCLLKDVVKRRPDFKLIVTSATLDAEKFSTYFFNSPIFTIPGKIFPVEILHSKEPESDYVEACLITVLNIHLNEHPGDILVFLTGQDEINTACEILHERMKKLESMSPPPLIILPIYSSLPSEMQSVIFDPAPQGCRKCILATNIAEASLTIDGIFFVIDPGFCKIRKYDSKRDMDSLVVAPISKANAKQRAGRAGRTGPGKCYRLYTEDAYKNEMAETSIPEIQRINLGSTVLLLKALGVNDFLHFDFMDSPSVDTLIHSLENLYYLGALDDNGYLTKLGKKMSNFPMEPNLSKILLTSINFNCADDVVTIVSMLSVQNIFYRPQNKALLADKKKNKFLMPQGDLITYLNIYNRWRENNYSNYWCHENFIHSRALKRSQDVRKQILSIFERYNYEVQKNRSRSDSAKYVSICKSICSGYFNHVCKRDAQQGYTTLLTNQQVFIHPSSTLFNKNPLFVVYHELVLTNKEYIRDCTIIQPQWLIQLAPNLFIPADEKKISKIKLREKIEPLHNYYEEPNAWRLSRRKG
ncbi:pre-mRNA-splicing factor ATP-dependent RNA helicase PRP22, putative [Plasmodium vivax]|uniref:RNA helicase n=1 Tax=Plasmodium vivax TaxID=5855 RepID=A0A1G4H9U0_PLAVI|nr:pre-mRNA-splicing factor ATP-dependent RNA helicase PRP22, putative [Plasmodium vivax]